MKLTSDLFADFLNCPTKCYLRSIGQAGTGNTYAEWVREQNDAYRADAAKGLIAGLSEGDAALAPSAAGNLKTATWRLAVGLPVQAGDMESQLQTGAFGCPGAQEHPEFLRKLGNKKWRERRGSNP